MSVEKLVKSSETAWHRVTNETLQKQKIQALLELRSIQM